MLRNAVVAALLAGATAASADTIEEKAKVCGACHGQNGLPKTHDSHHLGPEAGYLYLQFRDFQKGRAQE